MVSLLSNHTVRVTVRPVLLLDVCLGLPLVNHVCIHIHMYIYNITYIYTHIHIYTYAQTYI